MTAASTPSSLGGVSLVRCNACDRGDRARVLDAAHLTILSVRVTLPNTRPGKCRRARELLTSTFGCWSSRYAVAFPLHPSHTATVTRRKVAGMEVASSLGLAFWLLKRASSSACRSASRPLAAAASNAFMVGP